MLAQNRPFSQAAISCSWIGSDCPPSKQHVKEMSPRTFPKRRLIVTIHEVERQRPCVSPDADQEICMIRPCKKHDFELIYDIINDGAHAYKGIIPEDRWTEPYMSRSELQHEIDEGVAFWGYEASGSLAGVMGIQPVQDVTLIRHAYVRSAGQKQGIGAHLLSHLRTLTPGPVLIGTWAAAIWAIRFYEKHGF
jgi:GNAT superfamily N-acetyltransferase